MQYLGHLSKYTHIEAGIWIRLLALYIADYDTIMPNIDILCHDCNCRTSEEIQALEYVVPDVIDVGNEIIETQKKVREKRKAAAEIRWHPK